MALKSYENLSWQYPDALEWMRHAREKCVATGEMILGVGAHDKPLITLGRHASHEEILDAPYLAKHGAQVYQVDRGGGATFHGPGQIVLYPVVDLNLLKISIPDFTAMLEQLMIHALHAFGIEANRHAGNPGVFVGEAKIGSIGLRVSGGVVTHGLSLNVSNTLDFYPCVRTCRKDNLQVTTMGKELKRDVDLESVGLAILGLMQAKINSTGNRESI